VTDGQTDQQQVAYTLRCGLKTFKPHARCCSQHMAANKSRSLQFIEHWYVQ